MKYILVSGASSGLGKYLKNKFSATKYLRKKKDLSYLKKEWDLIIICGFYTGSLNSGYDESYSHVKKLISLKCKKIIFISSIGINFLKYQNKFKHFKNKRQLKMYALSKYKCEKLSLKKNKTLVLRLSNIVGPKKFMRKSDLKNFIYHKNPKIKYTETSKFSLTDFEEVAEFIKIAEKKNYLGIHNLFRKDMVSLKEASEKLDKKTIFGNLYFESFGKFTFPITETKPTKFYNFRKKRSFEVLKKYNFK